MKPEFNDYAINLSRTRFSAGENLKTFRILFLLSFIIIVLSGLIYRQLNNVNDPLPLRIAAAVLCLTAYTLSFTSKYLKANIIYVAYSLASSLLIWVIYIVALNHFNANFSIALMMVSLAIGVIFNKTRHLIFYYLFTNCCIEIACITTENIEVNGLLYMVYTAGSSMIFYIVLSKNIKNNEQLLLNKEYLTSIFNNAPEGLFIVNNETGEIYDCNRQGCKILEAGKRFDLTGKKFESFLRLHDQSWSQFLYSSNNKINFLQIELLTLNNKKKWAQLQTNHITFNGQELSVIQVSDISEQKTVRESQLIQLKNLENTNNELHAILQNTSDDIKAPLRTLANLTSWLATDYKDKMDSQGEEQLELVNKKIKKLYSMVDDIAIYSKTTKKNKLLESICIKDAINDTIKSIYVPKNITIELAVDLPFVLYDTERLNLIFTQLIKNAIKSITKLHGNITISHTEDDRFYQLSITDNGSGIEKIYFDKIFQVFQKLSFDEDNDSQHTGLGLTIVKKIIENYGGKIWLESEIDFGSTFYFTIPK